MDNVYGHIVAYSSSFVLRLGYAMILLWFLFIPNEWWSQDCSLLDEYSKFNLLSSECLKCASSSNISEFGENKYRACFHVSSYVIDPNTSSHLLRLVSRPTTTVTLTVQ